MKGKGYHKIFVGWILLSILFFVTFLLVFGWYQRKINYDREAIFARIYRQNPEVARIVLNDTMKGDGSNSTNDSVIRALGYTRDSFYKQGNHTMAEHGMVLFCVFVVFLAGGTVYFWHWQSYWCQQNIRLSQAWQQERAKLSDYEMQWNHQKRLRENMKVFTENIAHQLKTPLARITLTLDTMEAENVSEKRDMCLQELEEVRSLVEEVLNLARMESGKVPLHSRPIELLSLLEDAMEKTGKKQQYQWKLVCKEENELIYYGDEVWLLQAFFNLYDNAARYTPKGEMICTEIHLEQQGIQLEIQDSGGGIPGEALEALFERFYCANSQDMTRTGIGLNLAREVIRRHQGQMQVYNVEGGAVFSVWLPVYSLKKRVKVSLTHGA